MRVSVCAYKCVCVCLVPDLEEEAGVRAERWIPPQGSDK